MKIYFAGSIRGGRGDHEIYFDIITELKKYGQVLTEHVGNKNLTSLGENLPTHEIFQRDVAWVQGCDCVVAEVTTPSLGVGYEIGRAEAWGKEILCLWREVDGKSISGMISGNKYLDVQKYSDIEDIRKILEEYFK